MIVLDTTVLVYATGVEHPLREPCRRLIDAIRTQQIEATTTVEVIQEFVHARARRRTRDDAVRLGNDYVDLLSPLISAIADDLRLGLELYREHERLGAFDSVLAAAALRAGASTLVSADAAFGGVPGLVHLRPDEAAIDALLDDV